jgi:hypothetical protein
VQTHRAAGYPTILQAFNERARIQENRKLGLRLGEWKVIKQDGQRYEVRIYMREQGTPSGSNGILSGTWIWRRSASMRPRCRPTG